MEIAVERLIVATEGEDGEAVGSALTSALHGELIDIHFAFTGQPATLDTVVSLANPDLGAILTLSNDNSNGRYALHQDVHDDAGSVIADLYAPVPLNGNLLFELDDADAHASALVATIRYRRY